jgi:acyl-CoA thioesterase-1
MILQRKVDELGYDYEVVNMGASGDTSAGGLSRVDWALEGDVRVLVVALGGNDALRGLSPADMARNLGAIVDKARARGVTVLLCGMEAPPNFGASYTSEFRAAFRRLAQEKRVALVPFLLEGVGGQPALNQADGIHPNAEGARRVGETVWSGLQPLLDSMASR